MDSISCKLFPILQILESDWRETVRYLIPPDFPGYFEDKEDYANIQETKFREIRRVEIRKSTTLDPYLFGGLVKFWDGKYGYVESYEVSRVIREVGDYHSDMVRAGHLLNKLKIKVISDTEFKGQRVLEISKIIKNKFSYQFVGFAC